MTLKNLCPHPITLKAGQTLVLPASAEPFRLEFIERVVGNVDEIPLIEMEPVAPPELPVEDPDTLLVVPTLVRLAFPWRKDLASPARLIRGEAGEVTSCGALAQNVRMANSET